MSSRLIGECLEINADIVKERTNTKLPSFIADIISSYYRKRLLKSVKKLRNSHYILTSENLLEFFNYTFNNFPPYGTYKSVSMSKIFDNDNYNTIVALIKFEDYTVDITIYSNIPDYFDINIINDSQQGTNKYFLHLNSLYSENNNIKDILNIINEKLLNDITDYIIDTISIYGKKSKRKEKKSGLRIR